MKTLFNSTGYKLYSTQQPGSLKISFSYIQNADGSLKWFWNSKSKKPLFLKFYSACTVNAKLYSIAVRLIFELGLQRLLFKKETLYCAVEGKPVFNIKGDWAMSTGTAGADKALLYAAERFYKIACTETAKDLLINELANIRFASSSNFYSVPRSLFHNGNILQTRDISKNGHRQNTFGRIHAKAVKGIGQRYQRRCLVANWGYFQMLKKNLNIFNDENIPPGLIRKLYKVIEKVDETQYINLSFSHGDFTSWNCYVHGTLLSIYDWELASCDKPKGFDFFHFIIRNGILVDRKHWKAILKDLKQKNRLTLQFSDAELIHYLKFYLIINISEYFTIQKQKVLDEETHLLLQTWTEALNEFAKEIYTEKELLIMDMFDSMHLTPYAVLKFPDQEPEKLSPESEIDILVSPKNAENIIRFLKSNSLTDHLMISKKSFMYSIRIIMNNNQILHLNLIQKIGEKSFEFMKARKMIKRSVTDTFGIKTACDADTAKYLHYFYSLNEKEIPECCKDFIKENIPEYKQIKITEQIKELKMQPEQRISFLKNTFIYIKGIFSGKEFVMSINGVKGTAGSTVISETANLNVLQDHVVPATRTANTQNISVFPFVTWEAGEKNQDKKLPDREQLWKIDSSLQNPI